MFFYSNVPKDKIPEWARGRIYHPDTNRVEF